MKFEGSFLGYAANKWDVCVVDYSSHPVTDDSQWPDMWLYRGLYKLMILKCIRIYICSDMTLLVFQGLRILWHCMIYDWNTSLFYPKWLRYEVSGLSCLHYFSYILIYINMHVVDGPAVKITSNVHVVTTDFMWLSSFH